jgi:hypothetical protein
MTNGIHEQDDQLWSLKNSAKLVFCTWNSLGQSYSVSGVFERLAALQAGKTLEKYEAVLLDDGWQDVEVIEATNLRALRSFSTREGWMDMPELKDQQSPDLARIRRKDSGFIHSRVTSQESIDIPSSTLKQAVDAIKARYSEVKHVGTWVTLEGYWNGLHPDSEISREYELVRFGKRQPLSQYPYPPEKEAIYLPALGELDRFWTDYFTTLHDAGVDFVKVRIGISALRYSANRRSSTDR